MFTGRQILKNTLLLTAAALLLRLLSMLFQAYLAGRIGAEGLGGVQLVLSVSAFAATLGLAGARVAASCLCAEAYGRRDSAGLQGAAAHCLGYVLLTSMLAAAGLLFCRAVDRAVRAAPAGGGGQPAAAGGACCRSGASDLVLGGYLTAAGQVLRLTAVDAWRARVLSGAESFAAPVCAGGGWAGRALRFWAGICSSSCGAAAVLYAFYRQGWRGVSPSEAPPGLGRRVRKLAAPLALSDYLRAALRTLEQLLIPWGLAQAGASQQRAMAAYGTVTGMVFPVLMLPAAFLYALIDLLIPELAACRAQRPRGAAAVGHTGSVCGRGCCSGALRRGCCSCWPGRWRRSYTAARRPGGCCGCLRRWRWSCIIDALVDGMLKGLSEQVANVRYNTITSALDVALLLVLLPRYGLGGYVFTFIAAHLVNFALSLRRLLCVTGLRASASARLCGRRFWPRARARRRC